MSELVRDFTDEAREEFKSMIETIEDDNWCGFTDWIGDAGLGLQSQVGSLNIDKYLNNISSYNKKVIDKNNTTKVKIDEIFDKVKDVDSNHSSRMRELNDRLVEVKKLINTLADVMNPTPIGINGGCALIKPVDEFSILLKNQGSSLLVYYTSLLMTKNENGKTEYNWENLKELMGNENVTQLEYVALISMVDSMTTVDENGNVIMDTSSLEHFIECSYLGPKVETELSMDLSSGYVQYKYEVSPVFKNLGDIYIASVDYLVQQNTNVLFSIETKDEATKGFLSRQMFKATMFNEVTTSMENLTMYSDIKEFYTPEVNFTINYNREDEKYHLDTNGFIQDKKYEGVDIYNFKSSNDWILKDLSRKVLKGMYRKKGEEFASSIADEGKGMIVDSGVNQMLALAPKLGVPLKISKFALSTAIRNQEIDENNKNIDGVIRNIDLEESLDALALGGSISVFDDFATVNHAYIDETKLQINLLAYEKNGGINISIEDVKAEITGVVEKGTTKGKVDSYINWYVKNTDYKLKYRNKLDDLLTDYYVENPNKEKRRLEELTMQEIIQINEKLKDSSYKLYI